jgi:YVTN family beta-propeller protein
MRGIARRPLPTLVAVAVGLALLAVAAPARAATSHTAYVANANTNSVTPIDTTTNVPGTAIPVGAAPVAVAIAPDATTAYVPNSSANSVSVIDTATNTVSATIPVGNIPFGVALAPDGTRAYVANLRGASVSVIDTATNTVSATVPVGRFPEGIAVTPDGSTVFVVNDGDNNVSLIDTATNTTTGTIAVGVVPGPVAITPDGRTAYVGGGGATPALTPIDIATRTTGTTIPASNQPFSIAISPDGRTGYSANFVGGSVTVFDVATNTATATISGLPFKTPTAIAITPDGASAYVVDFNANTVIPFDTATNTRGTPIAGFSGPEGIAITPSQPPTAAFSATPAGPGHPSSFDASASTDPDGTIASYVWDFGDASPPATTTSPLTSHTYAAAGTYAVTVTESDDAGCSTTRIFTGTTTICNGSGVAAVSHDVTVPEPPELSLTYGATSVPLNGSTSLTVELSNPNAATALSGVGFDDMLPGGLQIATPNGLTGTCSSATISAMAGSSHLIVSGTTLAAATSCTFSVDVTGIAAGSWLSTATPTASETGDGSSVSPRLDVVAPPAVAPAFGAASTTVGADTSLTLAIANPNASLTLTSVGLSLTLPSGLVVATPNGLTGSCGGGTIGAAAAATTVTLAGATLPGGANCSFSVQVEAVAVGARHVSVAAGSDNGGTGPAGTADLDVGRGASSTTLAVSPASAAPGAPVTFTATVGTPGGPPPTGTVSFSLDGASTPAATASLSGGDASFTISSLTSGTHSAVARYGGDSNFGPSSSIARSVTVAAAPSPPPPPPPPPLPPPSQPRPPLVLSDVSLNHRCVTKVAVAKSPTATAALKLRFRLSEPAQVVAVLLKSTNSRRRTKCPTVRGTKPLRFVTAAEWMTVGAVGVNQSTVASPRAGRPIRIAAGSHTVRLAASASTTLTPGTYVLKVRAIDSTGRRSNTTLLKFWVLVARHKRD